MTVAPHELENDLLTKALAFKEKSIEKPKEEDISDILDILDESLKIADNNNKPKEDNIDLKLIINFKKAFCGNLNVYSYCDINGKWAFAEKEKITLNLIEKHLKKEITLGSYYAYKQNNKEYCRYICYDYDLHPLILEDRTIIDNSKKVKSVKFPIRLYDEKTKKINENIVFNNEKEVLNYYWEKSGIIIYEIIEQENEFIKKEKYRIEANELNKLKNLTKEIREFLINSCNIPETAICREISGRGYHIWIFPKDLTTLKRAYDYSQYLNKKILQSFGIECEMFPKQDSIGVGIGNFVKLPLSINRKTNTECVILDNFDYNNIKGFKIDETISKNGTKKIESITIPTPKTKKTTKLTIGSATPSKIDDKLPKVFDVLLECHRDVLSHKIDYAKYYKEINKEYYKDTKGTKEFEYLKELFWQVHTKTGLTHESLYPYLKKQSHFNIAKTEEQLKYDYHNYKLPLKTKDNPNGKFIKASWKKLYPDYAKKKPKKKKKKKKEEELSYYDLRDLIINQNLNNTTNIITIRENEELCRRSNGVYIRKAKSFINTQITHLLEGIGIAYSPYKKKAIVELIKTQTYHSIKEFDTNEELLNVKNGVLNLNTRKFEKHNTSDLFFIQIPVEYNPNAECPKIEKFMSEIFKKEDIDLIYEFIGLCLTPEMRFQKALMLYGNGNNGKTTFLNLLVSLIGKINKSSVPLSQLNKTFEGAKLEGRLINLVSDLDSSKMAIRFFKMYVGNELSITIDRKFKEPYDTKPTAKLLYSCNAIFPEIPKDTDKGFFRKWILIECPNEFDEKENLEMLDSLITEKELSGFLNKTIEGLYRLLKRGRFEAKYTNWFDVRKIWTEKANPFNSFIDDNEEYKKGDYIDAIHDKSNQFWETKKYTLKLYNKYLEEKINVPSIQQSLLTRIINNSSNFSLASRKINGKREEVYTGFKLQEKKSSYKNL